MSDDQLVTTAAVALRKLITSPNFSTLDKSHSIQNDIIELATIFKVKQFVEERFRLNRLNLIWFIEETARVDPAKDAIWCQGRAYSYAELAVITDKYGRWLREKGVKARDQVAIMMVNTEEFLFTMFALIRLGAVPCHIDYNLRDKGLRHVLSLHSLAGIVTNSHILPHLHHVYESLSPRPPFLAAWDDKSTPLPHNVLPLTLPTILSQTGAPVEPFPLELNDLGFVLYTSGTTGLPKGVQWPVSKVIGTAGSFINFGIVRDDRIGAITPLYHGASVVAAVLCALAAGATTLVFREFSASKFWQRAIESGMTRAVYVGEIPRYLLNQPPSALDRQHKVKGWAGVGLRPELWVEFKKRFGVTSIYEWYGQTEAPLSTMIAQHTRVDGAEPDAGIVGRVGTVGIELNQMKFFRHDASTGKPLIKPNGELDEVGPGEVGELGVRIDHLATPWQGYFKNPDASASKVVHNPVGPGTGSYYLSGDVFVRTPDGAISFKDRTGDTYRWKGENVATTSVELVLTSIPGVSQANCYGVKVPHHDGRAGMAAIVTDPAKFDLGVLAKYLVDNLPGYAHPVWIRITPAESIQVSAIFKLQKVALSTAAMDPSKVNGDKLYMLDQRTKTYLPFGAKEFEVLSATRSKL